MPEQLRIQCCYFKSNSMDRFGSYNTTTDTRHSCPGCDGAFSYSFIVCIESGRSNITLCKNILGGNSFQNFERQGRLTSQGIKFRFCHIGRGWGNGLMGQAENLLPSVFFWGEQVQNLCIGASVDQKQRQCFLKVSRGNGCLRKN